MHNQKVFYFLHSSREVQQILLESNCRYNHRHLKFKGILYIEYYFILFLRNDSRWNIYLLLKAAAELALCCNWTKIDRNRDEGFKNNFY